MIIVKSLNWIYFVSIKYAKYTIKLHQVNTLLSEILKSEIIAGNGNIHFYDS